MNLDPDFPDFEPIFLTCWAWIFPHFEPKFSLTLNLDFSLCWTWIFPKYISKFKHPNFLDCFCHYECEFSKFSPFLVGFSRFFILISINEIGYSIHFCCQQCYVLPYISYQSVMKLLRCAHLKNIAIGKIKFSGNYLSKT